MPALCGCFIEDLIVELVKAIVLGIIQGFTEFLPISSSGHLVIGSQLLNFQEQGIVFDIFLHLGTLLAVVLVFRKELLAMTLAPVSWITGNGDDESRMYFMWDVYVVAATIPAVVVALFFKDVIEGLFTNLSLVYAMLLITAVIMVSTRYLKERASTLNLPRSVVIGCAQACAIMPGLSRSGSTIFTGMALGINREIVARFSFIMSIPAILGAVVLQAPALIHSPPGAESIIQLAAGTVMSALSGYVAIVLLLDIVRKNRLQYFGYYCFAVALAGFGYQLLK